MCLLILLSLSLPLTLSTRAADKTQYFVHLGLNSTLHLFSGISNDLQKLLEFFNEAAIFAFFRIPFALSASVFRNNLALYLKDLKLLSLATSTLKLVASFFGKKHKPPVVSK